jgi:hypothetical protein
MNNAVLFRKSLEEEDEFNIASSLLPNVFEFRTQIPENSLVIARYSALPFYKELEEELALRNSKLINNFSEHRYIADIENWYRDISDFTPKTWFTWGDLQEGKYVVKGRTNSRKFNWSTSMFADGRENLLEVIRDLLKDDLISHQGLCVREYVPLVTYQIGMNGMRFTNEWRMFFYKDQLVDYGYYWSIYDGERPDDIAPEGKRVAQEVASIISKSTNFFVIDMAETEAGDWIVIEINDGQMSGLSTIDHHRFYKNLKNIIFDEQN